MTERIEPTPPATGFPPSGAPSSAPDSTSSPASGKPAEKPSLTPLGASTDAGGEASPAAPKASLRERVPPLRGMGGIVLLCLVVIGFLSWQWLDLRNRVSETQQQLARRLAEGATQLRDAKALAAAAQDSLQGQATKITVLEAKLSELNTQQGALEGLFHELSRGRDEWLLSEVDQLVGLAAQQLQLAGNVQGAISALSNAEARLARSERPQFVTLRKAIGKDLQKLKNLPLVDVAGLALRLENAVLAVDKMGLAFEARPLGAIAPALPAIKSRSGDKVREPATLDWPQWWQRWSAEVWGEIHALIRIERFDRPDPAVLAPQNSVFLRENIKIRLLGARLALLGRDQATFKGELRQAVQWLEKYFDPRDRNVLTAMETLKPLLATDLSVEPPALSDSQSALRAVKLSADRIVR